MIPIIIPNFPKLVSKNIERLSPNPNKIMVNGSKFLIIHLPPTSKFLFSFTIMAPIMKAVTPDPRLKVTNISNIMAIMPMMEATIIPEISVES